MIRTAIVEDDPMVAQINKQYIECLGDFRVVKIASVSADALQYLRANPVDLIILDIYMPGMDGLELLRTLRSEKCSVSVIMVTAANDTRTVGEALHLGVVDYLIKPYSFERFREAIQKYSVKSDLLGSADYVDQETVNRLLSNRWTTNTERKVLQKGLSPQTLDSIIACMMEAPEKQYTCESLSESCGLSKVTVRHYFSYLIETGRVVSSVDYETGGRPRVQYKLISD